MKSKFIDCCGLSCPEPVIQARKAMQESGIGEVKVRVDSSAARDNVSRSARALGWQVQINTENDRYLVTLTRS
ncbi:MAG: SirA family protein [Dethiobacter sp.]|nr:MAG: SirA family protein [Dethiobacter sp.]